MDRSAFVEALVKAGAVQFGTFSLASGKTSAWYCDIKRALTVPALLRHIAREMAPYAAKHDSIAGVELGAVPIAAAVSLETGLPFLMVRKAAKGHGTQRDFEGPLAPGDRILFVEDVVTTGSTLASYIERIRGAGATVEHAVAVVDRDEGGVEALRAIGVRLETLLTADEILEHGQQP